jgi:arylsulfatase A-like enzyme
MDTVRVDHLSCYGYARPTTPRIDALARESVLFEHAVAPSPWTLPSHGSLFTGLYPSSHGCTGEILTLSDANVTLAEVLHDHSYQTGAFVANIYLMPEFGFAQGFSTYEMCAYDPQGRLKVSYAAAEMNAQVFPWLEARARDYAAGAGQPFFLFVNYMDAHAPYVPPSPYDALYGDPTPYPSPFYRNDDRFGYVKGTLQMTPRDRQHIVDFYDSCLTFLDHHVGALADRLAELKLAENTVLVVAADHGEFLGEHNLLDHRLFLYEELLNVPLVVRYPGVLPAGKRVGGLVQLTDVMPTLLDLVGVAGPPGMQGRNLAGLIGTGDTRVFDMAYAEYFRDEPLIELLGEWYDRRLKSVRAGDWKYIWASNGADELYDLGADRGESHNLIGERPDQATKLRVRLNDWLTGLATAPTPAGTPAIDPAQRERLRRLGY